MNNAEIRLRMLFGCYAETYYGRGSFEYLGGLEGVKLTVKMANRAYLIDRGLVNGDVDEYPDGTLYAETGRILPAGVDIVERITRGSIGGLGDRLSREILGAPDTHRAFWEKCVNVATVCKVAVEVAVQVFASG
ncbi:MAG: hypothetical protein OXU25_09795 [Thaumarchaeota archaeon]|nr:hypothetical protein [Nitrososphaerota archaeon]